MASKTVSKRASRAEARRIAELKDLNKKSHRTGIPVDQLRKPKHKAKDKQK